MCNPGHVSAWPQTMGAAFVALLALLGDEQLPQLLKDPASLALAPGESRQLRLPPARHRVVRVPSSP